MQETELTIWEFYVITKKLYSLYEHIPNETVTETIEYHGMPFRFTSTIDSDMQPCWKCLNRKIVII